MTALRLILAALPLLLVALTTQASPVYFSFNTNDGGGAALVSINDATGKIDRIDVLGGVTTFADPKKLAVTGSGEFLILTSELHAQANVYPLARPDAAPQILTLAAPTGEVTPAEDTFFLTLEKGLFAILDPASGDIPWTWNARKELDPPGHKGESAVILADGRTAIATFQKDSSTRKGSRLVVFDLQPPRFRHDIQLPRDRPDLHIDGSDKEQGPNPELIFTAPASNTLIYSMDLYGGLGFTCLDAALEGRLDKHTTLSTHLDGKWGSAFPDRGTLFILGTRELLLISNASKNGGYVLIDVADREIIGKFPSPSGGEHPVWLPDADVLASAPTGKVKSRGSDGLEKEFDASPALHWFDVAPLRDGRPARFAETPLDAPVAAMTRAGRFLVVFIKNDEVLVIDPTTRAVIDRKPTPGRANRIATRR